MSLVFAYKQLNFCEGRRGVVSYHHRISTLCEVEGGVFLSWPLQARGFGFNLDIHLPLPLPIPTYVTLPDLSRKLHARHQPQPVHTGTLTTGIVQLHLYKPPPCPSKLNSKPSSTALLASLGINHH